MPRSHGIYPKDIVSPLSTYFASGRFGRMFLQFAALCC